MNQPIAQSTLMDAKTASVFLGISTWLVYELCKRSQLPHVRLGGRLKLRKEALVLWMETQER